MKDDQAPIHQLDHAEPTVIHHPEEDMTALARWLRRGMEQGVRFWALVAGVVLAVVAIAVISSGLLAGKASGTEGWIEVTQAKTLEERLKVAEAYPNTPAATWARLYSAEEEYSNGVDDLTAPGKKDLAGPRLKKALDLFQQVAKEAPKDSSQALGGLFGAARTLEARNELPEAIEQYKLVAERFPKTPEAKQALAMAKALEEPVNQLFYKELYAYKPPATPAIPPPGTIPGLGGLGGIGSSLNPPKSFLDGVMKPPTDIDAPPPSTAPVPALEPPKGEAPKDDQAPVAKPATVPPTDAPKPEAPKTEVPATTSTPPK